MRTAASLVGFRTVRPFPLEQTQIFSCTPPPGPASAILATRFIVIDFHTTATEFIPKLSFESYLLMMRLRRRRFIFNN